MPSVLKPYLKPSFAVCVIILLAAAVSKEAIIHAFGLYMTKEPILLQHPFDEFNENALLPYTVNNKSKITNRDVVESLGTEYYLQWRLEDSEMTAGSPMRYCNVFITYYTGNPDMVPHVPDECYVGGGNAHLGNETLDLEIPRGPLNQNVSFQYAMFSRMEQNVMKEEKFSVQYLFHANGKYYGSRTDTRVALGSNWFSKYSYFCKVEWNFYGFDAFGIVYPDKTQTLEASRKLLTVLLPELEKNHWPDWEAINAKPPQK